MPQMNDLCVVFTFMFFMVTSASITEKLLQIPVLEVGNLWVKAAETQIFQFITCLTYLPDMTSPWTYFKAAAGVVILYGIYIIQFRPLNRVRKDGDIGYQKEGVYSVKETANFVQKWRKVGNIPPPYPDGWFGVLESICLKKGEAKAVSAFGQNFAIFRDQNGSVHILDAFCPHMGANLAVGGRVIGDCIECPFHAWRFRGEDGMCVHIPYTDKVPGAARVKSWPVKEVSGWIFVWHHSEGIDPTWVIPEIKELENQTWIFRGRTEHYVNAHIEEISENGADVVHLHQVHGPVITAGADLRTMWNKLWAFSRHCWTATWKQCPEPDGHVGLLKLTHDISVLGFLIPIFKLTVSGRQIGPGLVYLEFEGIFGRGVFLQVVTPQGPLLQKVVHHVYANSWMPAIVAKICMIGEAIQVERDIMIWNNKKYQDRPVFVKSKEDSLISQHRRWFSQFYSQKNRHIFQKDDLNF